MDAVHAHPGRTPSQCAYCHDALAGDVVGCPRCGSAFHKECRAELDRCPTLGCEGALGDALHASVPGKAAAAPSRVRWTCAALAARGVAGFLVLAALGAAVVALAYHLDEWRVDAPAPGKKARGGGSYMLAYLGGALILGGGAVAIGAIAQALALRRLLLANRPRALRLTVRTVALPTGERRYVDLRAPSAGEGDAPELTFQVGFATPRWLLALAPGTPVAVHDGGPSGLVAVEALDGRIAWFNPMAAISRLRGP